MVRISGVSKRSEREVCHAERAGWSDSTADQLGGELCRAVPGRAAGYGRELFPGYDCHFSGAAFLLYGAGGYAGGSRPDHSGDPDPDGTGGGCDGISGRSGAGTAEDGSGQRVFQTAGRCGSTPSDLWIFPAGEPGDHGLFHASEARREDRHRRRQRLRKIHGQQADHGSVPALGWRNPL